MANTSLLKYSLKTNIVKSIYFEIISKVSKYFYCYGKTSAWPTVTGIDTNNQSYVVSSEDDPPAVSDSYTYELETRKNIAYVKSIEANDAAIVVSRINWKAGFVFDMYDEYTADRPAYSGATSLDQANFYALTSSFNVYKCLFNNDNAQSVVEPTGNSPEPITLSDGYVWKFMYSIPLSLRNKFLTSSHMPVTTALTNQFYSNGGIISYTIENRGSKYIKNAWKVKNIVILNGGVGYDDANFTIVFEDPDNVGETATAEVSSIGPNGNIITIAITNQGSGYSNQPVPVITAPVGSGLEYVVEYEKDDSAYTELKVVGDGYNEINPYSLKTISITNRGEFSSTPGGDLFTFPSPGKSYGRMPILNVVFREKVGTGSYEVDYITIEDNGYAYTEPLVFGVNVFADALTADGFDCDFNADTQKNEAELVPLINSSGEIEAIQVVEPGIGYTYASIQVVSKKIVLMIPEDPESGVLTDLSADNTTGFEPAAVRANFGIGDIDSKQSNVELLAVDGSIPIISVDYGGSGYPADTTLTIVGDGTDCTAVPTIVGSKITKVTVTNPGRGYTTASVQLSVGGGTDAILRPIISPKGGHGRDAVSELYAKTIAMVSRLSLEKNKGVQTTNDYRQITIIKNLKEYASDTYYRNSIGSSCILSICDIDNSSNTSTYGNLQLDDTLYIDQFKSFTLVEKAIINNKYYLVLQVNDNYVPASGATFYKIDGDNTYIISESSIELPDIDKYSGEMLYIDNRTKFTSSEEQSIVTTTLISF